VRSYLPGVIPFPNAALCGWDKEADENVRQAQQNERNVVVVAKVRQGGTRGLTRREKLYLFIGEIVDRDKVKEREKTHIGRENRASPSVMHQQNEQKKRRVECLKDERR
jgi:hypothetical protein